jgi:hypothetical protein
MKPIFKYAIWTAVIVAGGFAIYKGYQLYQAKQAAKAAIK